MLWQKIETSILDHWYIDFVSEAEERAGPTSLNKGGVFMAESPPVTARVSCLEHQGSVFGFPMSTLAHALPLSYTPDSHRILDGLEWLLFHECLWGRDLSGVPSCLT